MNEESCIIVNYLYPKQLLPEFHTAIYQLIVGVEQRHPQKNLDLYAKILREKAKFAFLGEKNNSNRKDRKKEELDLLKNEKVKLISDDEEAMELMIKGNDVRRSVCFNAWLLLPPLNEIIKE